MEKLAVKAGAYNKKVNAKNKTYYYRAHQRLAKYVNVSRPVRGDAEVKVWSRKGRGKAAEKSKK